MTDLPAEATAAAAGAAFEEWRRLVTAPPDPSHLMDEDDVGLAAWTAGVRAAAPLIVAAERERIIGSDRNALQLMLEAVASIPERGEGVLACAAVVRRLLQADPVTGG
jgi:hypothetical protein